MTIPPTYPTDMLRTLVGNGCALGCIAVPLTLTAVYSDTRASQVCHVVCSFLACAQLSYLTSWAAWHRAQTWHPLLCFYRTHLERATGGALAVLLTTVYYYTVFRLAVVSGGADRPALGVGRTFTTCVVTTTYATALETVYIALCMTFFYMHHQTRFATILAAERAITFHGTFKQVMEVVDALEYQSLQRFVTHWARVSDADILARLEDKKHAIFDAFREHLDGDRDQVISYDEFVLFAHANSVFEPERLWALLTQHQTTKRIDADGIDYMLYHTLFQKKHFAMAIHTDKLLARWIIGYIAMFSVPLLGIVLSSVWGYAGAFTGNLNLFQVFILAASFGMNRIASNVRFASYMASVRPFNMGELLFIDGEVYKVDQMTPTFVSCVGPDTLVLRNSQMLDRMVRNYSRTNVFDSFQLEMPLNTSHSVVEVVRARMSSYATEHWKDVDLQSVRCGWVGMLNRGKVLQCNWRYSFLVYDRSRFNTTRTRFVDYVISATIDDVTISTLLLGASQGGALNAPVQQHYQDVHGKGKGAGGADNHECAQSVRRDPSL
jgi:hypothetical protein